MVTPFAAGGAGGIDRRALEAAFRAQAEGGTRAVVLAGTTGENVTLTAGEYGELLACASELVRPRMKLIAGIGGNDTGRCLEKARTACAAGADALLMSTPYYNKTNQTGLLRHFLTVAEAAEAPVILYNVPSRTGMSIAPETYRALADHPNINGVKEASGDFSLLARLAVECGEDLNLWSGNDDQTIPMMALGAKGVISVVSNLLPREVARLCELCRAEDYGGARRVYAWYAELGRLLFCETNPIPVKAAMEMLGLDSGALRLPLAPLSEAHQSALRACLARMGLLPASA